MSTTSTTDNKPFIGALIFLHGLGDTPAGWSVLQRQLPQLKPQLSKIKYVFPPAPVIPLSINGGMRMTGWFDLYEWPISIGDPDDKINKMKGIQQIESIIHDLEVKDGISRNKIVIGGFSQGGAIALLSAYHSQQSTMSSPFAGCAVLSGWLTLVNEINSISSIQKQIPLFWGHGQFDDKVLFAHQKFGVDKLKELGLQTIEDYQYPMGHESHPKEMELFAAFLERVIFDDNNNNNKDQDL